MRLIAQGYTNKEIAAQLGVSVKTVETYKSRSMEKLGLRSRVDIVRVGTERIRVQHWLPEDPYPTALVEALPDEEPGPEAGTLRDGVERLLRRVLALQVELGFPAPSATLDLDPEPGRAAYQAAILSPLGPMDIQGLLEENGPDGRLRQLHALLEDARDLLSRRMVEG